MSDAVRIFLRDVRIMARVGYYEQEKLAPQPVLVSLELEAAALKDYREADGDLAQVVDYGAVHAYLTQELPRLPHAAFLETLAEHILAFCWRDARVTEARVTLQKPEILPGVPQAGIVLKRKRRG